MPHTNVGSVELEYEIIGQGRPLVLIMGLGAQMIFWDDRLCEMLAERGFAVIRFDHRDVGGSTRLDHLPAPRLWDTVVRGFVGLQVSVPYTLSDMARDVAGLMDSLGIDRADVVGASMGGMIAQHLVLEHPERVRSLTSIMSTPGGRWFLPKIAAMRALIQPRPRTPEQAEESVLQTWRVIGSPGFPFDEARLRALGRRAFERGMSSRGFRRHLAAIATAADRRPALRDVRTPTLVIHGRVDPLIPLSAGRATARAIPGARLLEIAGMGHDLPSGAWPRVVNAIAAHTEHAR